MLQLEDAADAQFVGSGPDQVGGAAIAEEQADRSEEEGLPRPGFAGPRAEARRQFDADIFDEGQIVNG